MYHSQDGRYALQPIDSNYTSQSNGRQSHLERVSNDNRVPKNKRTVNEDGLFEAEEDCAVVEIMYVKRGMLNSVRTHLSRKPIYSI